MRKRKTSRTQGTLSPTRRARLLAKAEGQDVVTPEFKRMVEKLLERDRPILKRLAEM